MKNAQGAGNGARLVDAIILGIQEVKGKDIVHMDCEKCRTAVCDHFVICHGDSDTTGGRHRRIGGKIRTGTAGEKPWHTEGESNREWILIDYVDVVVHIFHRDKRGFYARRTCGPTP
jgi:ribosome-associated protein